MKYLIGYCFLYFRRAQNWKETILILLNSCCHTFFTMWKSFDNIIFYKIVKFFYNQQSRFKHLIGNVYVEKYALSVVSAVLSIFWSSIQASFSIVTPLVQDFYFFLTCYIHCRGVSPVSGCPFSCLLPQAGHTRDQFLFLDPHGVNNNNNNNNNRQEQSLIVPPWYLQVNLPKYYAQSSIGVSVV